MSVAEVQGVGSCRTCHAPLANRRCPDCDVPPPAAAEPDRPVLDVRRARRAAGCKCQRPIPGLDGDGDVRCARCGRTTAAPPPKPAPVLYLCREQYATEAEARAEAKRRVPGCRIAAVSKRKVRGGRVVRPQGRPSRNGDRGRPIWRLELAA